MKNSGKSKIIGMLIDEAQDKKDELLISTLFDAVFRLKKRFVGDKLDLLLTPEVCIENRAYELRYDKGVVD